MTINALRVGARVGVVLSALALALTLGPSPAPAAAASQTISGSQISITAEDVGNLQARLAGAQANVFFPPNSTPGSSGLFIGFPVNTAGGIPAGTLYGPPTVPSGPSPRGYTVVSQNAPTGTGTSADPFVQVTTYKVVGSDGKDYLHITQTIGHVNGSTQFQVTYAIQNVTNSSSGPGAMGLRFRASAAGDTFIAGDDRGVGYFSSGPPRVVGGFNPNIAGGAGGIVEVKNPSSATWSHYQEGLYSAIWNAVVSPGGQGFNDTIDTNLVDNGMGVEWDNHYNAGQELGAGAAETYSVIWKFASPPPGGPGGEGLGSSAGSGIANLTLTPATQTRLTGDTDQVVATATDFSGNPIPNMTIRFGILGANPRPTSQVTTNAAGQTIIQYQGQNAGNDTLLAYLDLNRDGVRELGEPLVGAAATWHAALDVVGKVKLNAANGDIVADVVVPSAGTLTGTASVISNPNQGPTHEQGGTSTHLAVVAKARPYGHGTATAKGPGQVPVAIRPTAAGKAALRHHRKLHVAVHLAFRSSARLGSTTSSKDFRLKVRGKKH